tara:strand:+ start:419 stop:748 length:330 start_codon:yes stop_codon:yes gene_type:complete
MLIAQWKGAKVHHNVSCVGNTDMVLQVGDQYIPVDVKLARVNTKNTGRACWRASCASKVKHPVYPVVVIPEGDIMDWKIRWNNQTAARNSPPHCPPGLEDFWSKSYTNV